MFIFSSFVVELVGADDVDVGDERTNKTERREKKRKTKILF